MQTSKIHAVVDPEEVPIGSVLRRRYRVERVLGRGGMGTVVLATHLRLRQQVAIKLLLPALLENELAVQRFLQEARAAALLKSEHVARVIDADTLEDGTPYMVLEYLEGRDLASLPRPRLGVGEIVDLILQVCEALAEAHARGIVHRDIKPENLFLTQRPGGAPLLKVLDFGISKAPMGQPALTVHRTMMGTPSYISPEQLRSSRDVDHRSDIWSLGVVLYELLEGSPPFRGESLPALMLEIVDRPTPRLMAQVPADLAATVYRCLEKDANRRFQDVAELARAIAPHASSSSQAAVSTQRAGSILGARLHRPQSLKAKRPYARFARIAQVGLFMIGLVTGSVALALVVASASLSTVPQSPASEPQESSEPAPIPAPRTPLSPPAPIPSPALTAPETQIEMSPEPAPAPPVAAPQERKPIAAPPEQETPVAPLPTREAPVAAPPKQAPTAKPAAPSPPPDAEDGVLDERQ